MAVDSKGGTSWNRVVAVAVWSAATFAQFAERPETEVTDRNGLDPQEFGGPDGIRTHDLPGGYRDALPTH